MSGSAAVAAAKRRRAGGQSGECTVTPGGGRVCSRRSGGGQRQTPSSGSGGRAPPPILVHMHQQAARLARLEQIIQEGGVPNSEGEGGGGEGNGVNSEFVQQIVGAAFEELAGRIGVLEHRESNSEGGSQPSTDMAYFRDKIEELETSVRDMNRLLLKIQSFSMETNNSMMKLSGKVEKTENASLQLKKNQSDAGSAYQRQRMELERSIEQRIQVAVDAKMQELAEQCHVSDDEQEQSGQQSGEQEQSQAGEHTVEQETQSQEGQVDSEEPEEVSEDDQVEELA